MRLTDALHSLKSSVTDFACAHHCCPLFLVQFTVPEEMFLRLQPVTTFAMFNLFRLALSLVCPALIRFMDTKAPRFVPISRKHGHEPFL
jgi:hypothetical protein